MPELLKDLYFTRQSLEHMAAAVRAAYPAFAAETFLAQVFAPGWEAKELKDRMRHTTRCLAEALPRDYGQALVILRAIAPELHGFDVMVLPDFVEQFGQAEWDLSLPALAFFTRYASGEFAIRPFLDADPERALAAVRAWAQDPHPAVRRLASEGTRPRLPWAMALPRFKADPSPILPVLELLKADPDESVRRSVANNLNDISKDHPAVVLAVAERWRGQSPDTDWIVKHACRGLLRAGDRRAMRLFGFGAGAGRLQVQNLTLARRRVPLGQPLEFSFDLHVGGRGECPVRLEYVVDFARPSGRPSRKVFRLSEKTCQPGTHTVRRRHSLADRSTRKHYPGPYRVGIIVNGVELAAADFRVIHPDKPAPVHAVTRSKGQKK